MKVLDEYQKAFGDSWKSATADGTQEWAFLTDALTKFQVQTFMWNISTLSPFIDCEPCINYQHLLLVLITLGCFLWKGHINGMNSNNMFVSGIIIAMWRVYFGCHKIVLGLSYCTLYCMSWMYKYLVVPDCQITVLLIKSCPAGLLWWLPRRNMLIFWSNYVMWYILWCLWLNEIGYCFVADTGLCMYPFTPYLPHKEAYSHYSWYVHNFLGPCGSWQINENPEGLGWNKNYTCKCDVFKSFIAYIFSVLQNVSCTKYCWITIHCYSITYTFEYCLSLQNIHFSCSIMPSSAGSLALYIDELTSKPRSIRP